MIPEVRLVLYQYSPEIKQIALFSEFGGDDIAVAVPITLYARVPGADVPSFSVFCTAVGNLLSIPFTAIELAEAGNFDYSVYVEPVDAAPALKLRGVVGHGTGLEIVAVPGAA
ncbi:hypothetical protein H6F75_00615 [Nodosilinea sp. FACHB-131]|uniref:hypothetical protein n=1 Tax=Cyanophyceae TaxID=3028117 RepID=UPI001685A0C5|nr:hypothetical protein [Nodosilinea sp. FACHB-131]MBD1871973.1 hypothetical protein [Nodosilinea sp. FACHB-131]